MKIINRRLFKIKMGMLQKAAAMMREEIEAFAAEGGYSGPGRIYLPHFAPQGTLAVEWEYEDLAAYEAQWAEYGARPASADFLAKFGQLEFIASHNQIRRSIAANDVDGTQNGIAVRWFRLIKGDTFQEVISSTVAEFVTPGERVARISVPETGWRGSFALEMEYESLAEYEEALTEWSGRPETEDYLKTMHSNLRKGGRTEVWEIHH